MTFKAMKSPVCVILAGGQGTRLNALAWNRAKPAVPFAGIYRLIDFTISNAAVSGVERIGVLTQYLPLSLMEHIGDGASWDLSGRQRQIKILPPQQGVHAKDWYLGTAHAVYRNIDFIKDGDEKEVLILSGDHIYHMDYGKMLYFHRKKSADLTIAVMSVDDEEASRFGIAAVDKNMRITLFQEKPEKPLGKLGSMGIYIANTGFLIDQLHKIINNGGSDIGRDLIPSTIDEYRVFAFPFSGYWRDVGTISAYWGTSMDVLEPLTTGLNLSNWQVRTNMIESGLHERAPTYIGSSANVIKSFISPGCRIEGYVENSILSPGVCVDKDARVKNSILFHDVSIGPNSFLENVIADKNVIIEKSVKIGMDPSDVPNSEYPEHLFSGISLLGKNSQIGKGLVIGQNSLVFPECCIFKNVRDRYPPGYTFHTDDKT